MSFAKDVAGGVELLVLVQPRASRTKVLGEHDGRLKIALAAPPVDGEANAALVEFLAERVGVKRAQIELLDGLTGRRKRLKITGLDAARVSMVICSER
ncbi:MAG: DUF167 domain-containing protein [Myxococcaceae bacterium]